MTKHNPKTIRTNPVVAICHTDEEIVGDIKHVMLRDHQAAVGHTTVPSELRSTFRLNNPVIILVIEQAIEPRETETIWTEAAPDPSILTVVIARSFREQKRIGQTELRKVLGPNADSIEIVEAIEQLRKRRGRIAREAFEAGVIWLEPSTGRVRVHNRDVKVASDEFKLLEILASKPFRLFPKDELAMTLTGGTAIVRSDIRFVENLAHRLRHTLAAAQLDAVIEPAGLGFQLLPASVQKSNESPVVMKAAA